MAAAQTAPDDPAFPGLPGSVPELLSWRACSLTASSW